MVMARPAMEMERPAKELEKLSLKLREDAFIAASELDSVLRLCVRVAASKWDIELSYAELDVIAEHLAEDMREVGHNIEHLNLEREVKEDYAKDYEIEVEEDVEY